MTVSAGATSATTSGAWPVPIESRVKTRTTSSTATGAGTCWSAMPAATAWTVDQGRTTYMAATAGTNASVARVTDISARVRAPEIGTATRMERVQQYGSTAVVGVTVNKKKN